LPISTNLLQEQISILIEDKNVNYPKAGLFSENVLTGDYADWFVGVIDTINEAGGSGCRHTLIAFRLPRL
jgi:hypothetical protein